MLILLKQYLEDFPTSLEVETTAAVANLLPNLLH